MKTLIRYTICFSVSVMLILLLVDISQSDTDNINKNNFYIGAQGNIFPEYHPQFQALSYNTMVDWGLSYDFQKYEASWMGTNNRIYGGFFDTIVGTSPPYNPYPLTNRLPNGFGVGEQHFLTQWHNNINPDDAGSVFLGSARVYRTAMGQRSDYQVEDNAIMVQQSPGYGYEQTDMVNADYTDSWKGETQRVKRCLVGTQTAGFIAKKLYENGEQADVVLRSQTAFLYSDQKRIGDNFHWYVKPRMRIDSAFANNPNNINKKVCRIDIYNYAGRLLDSVPLSVNNFMNNAGVYDGSYKEMYRFINSPNRLEILSDSLVVGADSSKYYSSPDSSKIDYRIWWYGEVGVWVDYVRLDDEWAHFLFTDPWGFNNLFEINRYQFARRLHDEVANINGTGGFAYFYQDEFYYNHIPCMRMVDSLIRNDARNSGLVVMSNPGSPGLKNKPSHDEVFDYLKANNLFNNFIILDQYPIFAWQKYPPNLSLADSITQRYTATNHWKNNKAASSDIYNNELNSVYEQEWYYGPYRKAAEIIKTSATNTVLASSIQVHTVESNFSRINCNQTIDGWEFRREPTNEEISMQVYYSMSWGAKHLHYFQQWSSESDRICNGITERYYDQGITGHFIDAQDMRVPRYYNYFAQRKFDFIASLDSNLMKIGKYMYNNPARTLKYDASVSVHKDGFSAGYITNLKSYYRTPYAPFDFLEQNEDAVKYWQIGYFNDNQSQYDKYFILLNMRCVPETPGTGDGDLRTAKIYLSQSSLEGFNNWILSNPITGEKVIFDKNNITGGVNVPGVFNPGEGKLFKIEPLD